MHSYGDIGKREMRKRRPSSPSIALALRRQRYAVRFGFLLVVFLAGCGGGGEGGGDGGGLEPAVVAPAAPCTPVTQPVLVQLFGDSTQAGYATDANGASTIVAHNPAAELQAFFTAKYGVGAVLVSSRAMSGTRSTQLVAGTDGLNAPWPAQ